MSSSLQRLLLALTVLLASVSAHAVTVNDLYTAGVPVADKGGEAQRQGFRSALEQVLVRVAGSTAVLEKPQVQSMLEQPARLVQQFRYQQLETSAEGERTGGDRSGVGGVGSTGANGDGTEEPVPTHRLVVTFAGTRIEQQLRNAGIVVWGEQRPQVLVWLGVDDGNERRVVADDSDDPAHRALMNEAERRALPVLVPLMDMRDRSHVDYIDISGGFHDTLRSASDRYRANILLIGHVRREGSGWRADWTLLGLGERRGWSGSTEALPAAVALGVDGATDRLAATMAGRAGERAALRVRVRQVDSLDAYARVMQYFDQLVRVRAYSINRVLPGEVVLDVTIQGGIEEFERAVALGTELVQVSGEGASDAGMSAGGANNGSGSDAAPGESGMAIEGAGRGEPAPDPRPERVFRFAG